MEADELNETLTCLHQAERLTVQVSAVLSAVGLTPITTCLHNHADGNWLLRKAGLALSAWNTNAYSKQKGP